MSWWRRETPPDPEFDDLSPRQQHKVIVAAAQRINRTDRTEAERIQRRRQSSVWQDDAWAMYDAIGEIKYGFNLVAWAISRVRIFPAVINDKGGEPTAAHESDDLTPGLADAAVRALNRLGTGPAIAELLKNLALNMQVAGECYLVQQPRGILTDRPEKWMIKSVNELKVNSDGSYMIMKSLTGTQDAEELSSSAYVARIWRSHPRFFDNADCSMLGVLEPCDELLMLNRMIRAVARSRINAGILAISEDFSLLDDTDDEADPVRFEEEFQFAMTQPVTDESSASAVVPLLIRGPIEQIQDGIKYYEIARSVNAELIERADRTLERILQGIDLPKDILLGMANIKYSNALIISDSLYQAHIQPLAQLICDQLTEAYLHTAVQAYGFTPEQARRLRIWYDASDILTDSDKSQAASAGMSNYALSWEAWRRENGFTDADAPTAEELIVRVLLSRASLEDPTAQSIVRVLAPKLMEAVTKSDQTNSVGPLTPDVQSILNAGQPAGPEAAPPGAESAPAAPPPMPPPPEAPAA